MKGYAGNGLKCPSESGKDTTRGVMILDSILFWDLCSALCVLCNLSARACDSHNPPREGLNALHRYVVHGTLTYPIPLEAVLTAEERVFAYLLTRRTLQRACIIVAIRTLALFRLRDCHFFRRSLIHLASAQAVLVLVGWWGRACEWSALSTYRCVREFAACTRGVCLSETSVSPLVVRRA